MKTDAGVLLKDVVALVGFAPKNAAYYFLVGATTLASERVSASIPSGESSWLTTARKSSAVNGSCRNAMCLGDQHVVVHRHAKSRACAQLGAYALRAGINPA